MAVVMIQHGSALGMPLPCDGQYLEFFDHEAFEGRGNIGLTPDIQRAKKFESMAEAHAFWSKSPECRPLRDDGRPNRPLTAANWEFRTV